MKSGVTRLKGVVRVLLHEGQRAGGLQAATVM